MAPASSATRLRLLLVAVAASAFLLWLWHSLGSRPPAVRDKPLTAPVEVEVYYEVLCPDSRYFVLKQLYPAWQKVHEIMEVKFKPFGKAHFKSSAEGGYTFECQHGPTECLGNTVHACAARHVASPAALMEYVRCMMADNYVPMEVGKKCADELSPDVPWEAIRRCASGREGQELLVAAGKDTQALRPKASFIPTIVMDGGQGDQKQILKNFIRELCAAYKGQRPKNCVEIL